MQGRARRRPILVALIPAHDEEAALPAALGSLQAVQGRAFAQAVLRTQREW